MVKNCKYCGKGFRAKKSLIGHQIFHFKKESVRDRRDDIVLALPAQSKPNTNNKNIVGERTTGRSKWSKSDNRGLVIRGRGQTSGSSNTDNGVEKAKGKMEDVVEEKTSLIPDLNLRPDGIASEDEDLPGEKRVLKFDLNEPPESEE